MPRMNEDARSRFWSRTKRLTAGLLVAWLLVNLLGSWFARDLNAFKVWGFPLGFWVAAQGALIAYLAIIVVYVWRMDRLEANYLDAVEAGAGPSTGGPPT